MRAPKRLPESLHARDVAVFVADLQTARDRAMALLMLLGGLRAMEVRGLLLSDVDLGLRRVRVLGKGDKERTVPVDAAFFTELANYLRCERPPGCATRECFVVPRGSTRGQAMTEAGMRRIFRTHRARAGTPRVSARTVSERNAAVVCPSCDLPPLDKRWSLSQHRCMRLEDDIDVSSTE